jgi:hypothetical protein
METFKLLGAMVGCGLRTDRRIQESSSQSSGILGTLSTLRTVDCITPFTFQ